MAVDRGELRYTIEVDGTGPERVREFRAELVGARRAWRAFKQDIRSLGAESKALAQGTQALAASTRAAAIEQAKLAEAAKKAAAAQKEGAKAAKDKAKESKKETENEKRLNAAKKERLALERKLRREGVIAGSKELRNLKATLAAQKAINRAHIDRLKFQKLSLVQTRKEVAAQNTLRDRAKAIIELEEAKSRAADPVLAKARAQLAVEKQIAKEKALQLQNEIRISRGLQPVGLKPTPKEIKSTQQLAREKFDTDLKNAQIRQQTDLLKKNSAAWQELSTKQRGSNSIANRISFTFRRLFGILAAFTIIRLMVRGFQNIVKSAIKFNAQLEIAQLSIASLFVATSEVRDAMGGAVDASEQLALAQSEAARQTQLLRLDALKTAATFEQLLDTFQIAIAPGTRAGLGTDQIRQFTVRISQAATSLGVAQNQLSEEIRSILGGTIQLRTTRIAAALGITNEDIRRAKDAGKLYEFLTDRFEAFGVAGEKALTTFAGLTGRVSDGFKQLFGAGTFETFEQLKGLLSDIFQGLVEETPDGFLAPDPAAVQAVDGIAQGLTQAVEEARRLGRELNFEELVPITETIGDALQVAAILLGAVVEGVVKGLSTAAQIIQFIVAPFKALSSDTKGWGETLRSALVLVVQIVTAYFALSAAQAVVILATKAWLILVKAVKLVWVGFRSLVLSVKAAMVALKVATSAWALVTKAAGAPIFLILAAVLLLVVAAQKLLEVFEGIDLEIGTILRIVKTSLVAAFKIAWINIKIAGASVLGFFKDRILDLQVAWIEASKTGAGFFAALGEGLGIDRAKELNEQLALERVNALQAIEDQRANNAAIEKQELRRLDLLKEQVKQQRDLEVGQHVLDDDAGLGGLDLLLKEGIDSVSDLLGGVFDMATLFGDTTDSADTLLDTIRKMPGVLAQSRTELSRQAELVEELEENAVKASREFSRFIVSGGAEASIAQIRVALLDALFAEGDKAEKLKTELVALQTKQNTLLSEQVRLEATVAKFTDDQRFDFETGLATAKKLLTAQRQRAAAEKQIALARLELDSASKTGTAEAVASARREIQEQSRILAGLDRQIALEEKVAEAISKGSSPEVRKAILDAIRAQILLNGNLTVTEEQINAVLSDQGDLHKSINRTLQQRLNLLAQQQLQRLETEVPRLRAEADASSRLQPFVSALATDAAGERVAIAQNEVAQSTLRLKEAELQIQRDLAALQAPIDAARAAGVDGELALQSLLDLQNAKRAEGLAIQKNANIELQNSTTLLTEAVQMQEQGLQFGIEVGFAEFAKTALDSFNAARDFMQTALTNFSSLISQTIADAFDPTINTDIRERFGQFLKSLSQMIINYLTQLAITKLISSLIGGGGQQQQAGSTMIAAAVAWVPVTVALQAAANTLLLAATIQASSSGIGFAAGGEIPGVPAGIHVSRPKGLHPTDTVPIWAAPGEFMVRAHAVSKYGADVMSAINRGLVDPTSLRALSGVQKSRIVRARKTRGFADGGLVSSSLQDIASDDVGGSAAPSVAIVIADDQAADRMLNGGRNAVFEFMRENRETINSVLRG